MPQFAELLIIGGEKGRAIRQFGEIANRFDFRIAKVWPWGEGGISLPSNIHAAVVLTDLLSHTYNVRDYYTDGEIIEGGPDKLYTLWWCNNVYIAETTRARSNLESALRRMRELVGDLPEVSVTVCPAADEETPRQYKSRRFSKSHSPWVQSHCLSCLTYKNVYRKTRICHKCHKGNSDRKLVSADVIDRAEELRSILPVGIQIHISEGNCLFSRQEDPPVKKSKPQKKSKGPFKLGVCKRCKLPKKVYRKSSICKKCNSLPVPEVSEVKKGPFKLGVCKRCNLPKKVYRRSLICRTCTVKPC
jgi:hypothetical protein